MDNSTIANDINPSSKPLCGKEGGCNIEGILGRKRNKRKADREGLLSLLVEDKAEIE